MYKDAFIGCCASQLVKAKFWNLFLRLHETAVVKFFKTRAKDHIFNMPPPPKPEEFSCFVLLPLLEYNPWYTVWTFEYLEYRIEYLELTRQEIIHFTRFPEIVVETAVP